MQTTQLCNIDARFVTVPKRASRKGSLLPTTSDGYGEDIFDGQENRVVPRANRRNTGPFFVEMGYQLNDFSTLSD